MKVLHYVDENCLVWMAPWIQLLLELGHLGVQNSVLCRRGGTLAEALRASGITAYEYNPVAQWWPAINRGIGRIIKTASPDLIHTRLSAAAKLGGWWGRRSGIPVISTFDKYPKARYYKNSDVLIGCSSAVTDHIKTLDLPHAAMTTTILNPVLAERYVRDEKIRASFRAEKGITDDETVVLGMGRFVGWKAWDDYLRAIAMLPLELPLRFWLVGCGEQEQSLHCLAHELAIEDRVQFYPFASDVRPWLWAADVFVQTSREPEGFSLMLIEAMASGTAPIATNIGGTLDIVRDNENGFLFAPGDAGTLALLIRKISGPELRIRLSQKAVFSACEVNVEKIAAQTLQLYEKTLTLGAGRRGF
ncbi:MAG: glycosyltransferase [Pyramidobacter sp.]|nr:glycosyltransferase [Pyramidobacter sp.]